MNTKQRRVTWKVGMLAVLGMVGLLSRAEAASTDTIQLRVTPGVVYSVVITSADADVAYNFGTVNLNATTLSERPASVQNNGNVVSEWQVSAQGENTWTLGDSTGSQNVAVLKALFNHTGGAMPIAANYNTVNGSTITGSAKVAENNTLATNTAIVTNIPVSDSRALYFMLHTPVTSTVGSEQKFRVYVTAVAP